MGRQPVLRGRGGAVHQRQRRRDRRVLRRGHDAARRPAPRRAAPGRRLELRGRERRDGVVVRRRRSTSSRACWSTSGRPAARPRAGEARRRGEAYLLERRLFRRKSTGEVIDLRWLRFSFPHWYHYDVLRALDYLRDAGVTPDERVARGDRGRRGQARSRRPVAAPERPRGRGPRRDGGGRGHAEPLEHAPRAARARLVRPGRVSGSTVGRGRPAAPPVTSMDATHA